MTIMPHHSRRDLLRMAAGVIAIGTLTATSRRSTDTNSTRSPAVLPGTATPRASPAATPAVAQEVEITMTLGLRFDPEEIVIPAGTMVTWINNSPMPHTATGDPEQNPVAGTHAEYIALPEGAEPWGSELMQPGDTFSHTFTQPGDYRYICIPHVLSGMRGTIRVEP